MGEIKLDWQSAAVKDGTLHVRLDGETSKEWKASFERTAQLLNHGTWTEIGLKKGEVRVKPLAEGDEERVRHFLESVVLEANSETAPPEDDEASRPDGEESSDDSGSDEDSPDTRMTGRFREFGPADDASDSAQTA